MKTHRHPLASFLAFELRRMLRSPGVLVWTLAFPVVFYLLNFANKTNNAGAQRWAGTTWAVYFMVSMCAWAAIAAAANAGGARLAAERANGWTRYLRLTPLPSWAYAAGKVLTGAALALMAALALSLIAGAAARPQLPASAWAAMILACWLGSLPFAALGILIGLAAGTSVAQPAMVAVVLVLNVLGGLLVAAARVPGLAPGHREGAAHLPARRSRPRRRHRARAEPRRHGVPGRLDAAFRRDRRLVLPRRPAASHRMTPDPPAFVQGSHRGKPGQPITAPSRAQRPGWPPSG